MGAETGIGWTDATFNPWIGCAKVDELCNNCYAESEDKRRGWTEEGWGKGKPRHRTSEDYWKQPLIWNRGTGAPGTRKRVFCASLADWLDEEVPVEWLADLLNLIRATPNLDWQLLTKRPENFWTRMVKVSDLCEGARPDMELFDWIENEWADGQEPHNVWIGTSVGTQRGANLRIPALFRIPARVRFLSGEPLLEPVNLEGLFDEKEGVHYSALSTGALVEEKLDWVICGGESGPNARPMHPDWAWSLLEQCRQTGTPFFFKQWGEWLHLSQVERGSIDKVPNGTIVGPGDFFRVGKHRSGCLLNGKAYQAFPELAEAGR